MLACQALLDPFLLNAQRTIYPLVLMWVAQIHYIITFLFFESESGFTILTHNGGS